MLPARLRKRVLVIGCLTTLVAIGCEKSSPPPAEPALEAEPSSPATAPASSVDEPLAVLAGTTLYQLDVDGMHCQGCAGTITKKLKGVPGVKQARVSFNRQTAWVLVEAGSPTQSPQIEKAVADAGYKAKPASPPASRPA